MYKVQPKGINIKQNERDVPDGFLKESINLQWKDGSYRPIPERLITTIPNNVYSAKKMILHKVSDEDQVNVLTFTNGGSLYWHGSIVDGIYTELNIFVLMDRVTDYDSLSFTILNGIIYFMSVSQEFYYKVQFNEIDGVYETKNMYAWKDLIPFYPSIGINESSYSTTFDKNGDSFILVARCGVVLIRYTLVLPTGEEVLHSPIFASAMFSINTFTASLSKGDVLQNIHTIVNTNFEFDNQTVFDYNISAINIYASVPKYVSELGRDIIGSVAGNTSILFDNEEIIGSIQELSEQPFYLVKTIDKPSSNFTDQALVLYAGVLNTELYTLGDSTSKINTDTIAAGQVMPVDNFSYHKLFGKITSNNGRLIISNTKTILSNGHMYSLAVNKNVSRVGYHIDTEDGSLSGVGYLIQAEVDITGDEITSRGVLSYPDSRATYVGGNESSSAPVELYKIRANKAHNMSCAFNISNISGITQGVSISASEFTALIVPHVSIVYGEADRDESPVSGIEPLNYTSNNRIQFSESGEFSVWPALNSYRVGEGKIIFVGSNSVDPANADYIAPLLIGTSDGIYTVNFDPTGANLIQTITKSANLPALSENNIQIDQNLIYVSDKGLIVINNGRVFNITEDYFPDKGNGDFPDNNTIYPNYDLLTANLSGSDYQITDIVDYMKGAIFAYDGRRNNVWCSNPNESFSLVYNLETKQWTMSTYVFSEAIDFGSIINNDSDVIYSRYLVRSQSTFDILSGEDTSQKVYTHLLTRSIKIQRPDEYKKIQRLISRCELYRDNSSGYFTFGVWGKQDLNKNKENIPLEAYNDSSSASFPNNIRQDIPIGRMKGKYKTITILQGGLILPSSSLDNFEITAIPVENNILR